MPSPAVFLHAIAGCVPEHAYTQEFALAFMLALQGTTDSRRTFLEKVYRGSAIGKRHTVIDDYGKDPAAYRFYPPRADLEPEPPTMARNDLYIREAAPLALSTAETLLAKLPAFDRSSITHLVTVSCTGFSAPGFDLALVKGLRLPATVERVHIGFMGCYAAFPALRTARDTCTAHPQARVLIVCLELCSLHFQKKFEPDIVVANALFADGCAAALVSACPEDSTGTRLRIGPILSRFLEDSEADMAWKIGAHGFDMRLSLHVPRLIGAHLGALVDELFARAGRRRDEVSIWAVHPGGRAILEKAAEALGIEAADLAVCYAVLEEFGNMSSPTILFVLERILDDPRRGTVFATAFGPGLTVESAILEKETG
jgi:predicted naringenin-chalcone synthase